MYAKTINYEDFNGETKSEVFYFNLNRLELIDLELGKGPSGLEGFLKNIQEKEDKAAAVSFVKELIDRSYGVKSDDGQRFVKSPEVLEAFKETPAYDELFSLLISDEKEMEAFLTHAVPKKVQEEMAKQAAELKIAPKLSFSN